MAILQTASGSYKFNDSVKIHKGEIYIDNKHISNHTPIDKNSSK